MKNTKIDLSKLRRVATEEIEGYKPMFAKNKVYKSKANFMNYARSHELCEDCGSMAVDTHHITFKSQGGGDDNGNLIALCRPCHQEAHGKNSKEVRIRLKALKLK